MEKGKNSLVFFFPHEPANAPPSGKKKKRNLVPINIEQEKEKEKMENNPQLLGPEAF